MEEAETVGEVEAVAAAVIQVLEAMHAAATCADAECCGKALESQSFRFGPCLWNQTED